MMDVLDSDFDCESFSESGGSEEQEEIDYLYGGKARSILSSLEESIGKIDDFLSFERGFTHGDIVCSVTDPTGQMGRVTNITMFLDLENVYGKIRRDVNSQTLSKIRSISVGDYVVRGAWVGKVDKVVDSVSILFDDGSKCEFNVTDQDKLLPVPPNLLEDSQYPYYPGQRVQVRLPNVSKSTGWLCGTWRDNYNEGTVCAVEAGLVYVDWLASVIVGCDLHLPSPAHLQDAKTLTLLSCFSHANWQLGDWCILKIADPNKGILQQVSLNASTHGFMKEQEMLERRFEGRNLSFSLEDIYVIVKTKTTVDVVWQDGSCSLGINSQSLLPVGVVNAHEFWPYHFVVEKGTSDDRHLTNSQRWGVVLGVDAKERTVKVQWKSVTVKEATDFDEGKMEDTLSAYELVEHPDYSYSYGDVVFRLVKNHLGDQADKDQLSTEILMGKEALKSMKSDHYQNEYPDTSYPSFIGIITGFKDGWVEVQWAAGFKSKVAPYEIYRVDKYEESATTPVLYEENVGDMNQEMVEHSKQLSGQRGKDLLNCDGAGENCKKYLWESNSLFLPRPAIAFFSSIATSLFGSFSSTSLSVPVSSSHISELGNESDHLREREISGTCELYSDLYPRALQTIGKRKLNAEVKEDQENGTSTLPISGENPDQFRHFDMVIDCSDHHFLDASKGLVISQVKKSWLKKVHQEWSILQNNLPESIYVRIYEERMDLMRAAIVGATGTPYHDGLFFFDIFLPAGYPYEPPSVHYHSGGLRVNPNLYESGKVCLSLLNTWKGTGTEVWNPGSSTILQVLLSLQALVLNKKPYFNESGYDRQVGRAEGEKNSVSYNENAFLVTCKSMLYLLRKPPKHFEAFVEEHFCRRSQHILLACKAYMGGAPVGFPFGCDDNDRENTKGNSKGFKIMLSKLYPKLVDALSDKGINCDQFIQL
ncbi:UQ_con domain-containing protein [Cephalotus follicularis]|uniref:E2 ubiquitin-conjugating enzyme n=1 Tax=Cephalotus follicularis TaxID=3775 RepID=A0A1Q3D7X7_CEPFO|nr:UQ_con domain-containing protein [Cephalotus follicularis]